MATKFYLPSSGAPPVTVQTWSAGWALVDASAVSLAAVVTKIASTMTTVEDDGYSTSNPYFKAFGRWVFGPLSAGTVTGTVRGQMRAKEDAAGNNETLAIAVKLVDGGGVDRAALLVPTASDKTSSTPPELYVAALRNRSFNDASESQNIALTSQAITFGDYLVIEIGYRNNSATGQGGGFRYGDQRSSDLSTTEDDTNTDDYNPWVEFSYNFTIGQAVTAGSQTATFTAPTQTLVLEDKFLALTAPLMTATAPTATRTATVSRTAGATTGTFTAPVQALIYAPVTRAAGTQAVTVTAPTATAAFTISRAGGTQASTFSAPAAVLSIAGASDVTVAQTTTLATFTAPTEVLSATVSRAQTTTTVTITSPTAVLNVVTDLPLTTAPMTATAPAAVLTRLAGQQSMRMAYEVLAIAAGSADVASVPYGRSDATVPAGGSAEVLT